MLYVGQGILGRGQVFGLDGLGVVKTKKGTEPYRHVPFFVKRGRVPVPQSDPVGRQQEFPDVVL